MKDSSEWIKVTLIRHAKRSPTGWGDNPLNEIGLTQAQGLLGLLSPKGALPIPLQLVASPKKRAQQTLEPLSTHINQAISTEERLDLQGEGESQQAFERRVQSVLQEAGSGRMSSSVCLCSHLDWLEKALTLIPLQDMKSGSAEELYGPWKTAQFHVFQVEGQHWHYLGGGRPPKFRA